MHIFQRIEIVIYFRNNQQQITNIAETNYRTEGTGTPVPENKVSQFSYDANGNLLSINSNNSTKTGSSNRNLLWDEENRLLASSDNGFLTSYWYDAAGERTVKMSGAMEGVNVNGVVSALRTSTDKFTAYVNPYFSVRNGGEYSKHIYIGSQRITSKVSNSGIFANSPLNTTDCQARYSAQKAALKTRYDSLRVAYNGVEHSSSILSASPSTTASSYFYHSDHLGSSSLITDQSGGIVQHLEYVPFGETFIDERRSASSWTTPYLFSGKERDEETGLLYFGARYQDSKYGIWYSVDPLAEKYPNLSSYVYCHNNPINMIDPDGRTDYRSLTGKKYKVNDDCNDKKLVLKEGNLNQKDIDKAKANNTITSFPTDDEIKKMDEAYSTAEKTGNEAGYVKGEKGTLSRIEEGTSSTQMIFDKSKDDVKAKMDVVERYTHVHIYQSEGDVVTDPGNPNPTKPDDTQLTNGVNIILGYKKPAPPANTVQMTSPTYKKESMIKIIRFYNDKGGVSDVNYKQFKTMVKSVNNETN